MNLTEALDAALPEIPRSRLTRVRPPRLDPELILRDDSLDGEPIVGAFRRDNGNFYRLTPTQWQLSTLFDGERSYTQIASLFTEQTGAQIDAREVRTFAQNMDESGFWYQTPQEKNIALNDKLTAQRSRRAKRRSTLNVAHISFSAWDPDRYLTWLDGLVGRAVFSRWAVIAAVLLFCAEAVIFVSKWSLIGPDIPVFYSFMHKSGGDLAQFWLLFLILGFFHETAHGLACKHYGGEVHRMGLMLIYLTPAFYVDITETWISATRIQRLATIIAGIWVEMILCGFALIAWTNTQPGQWLHDISYQIILLTGLAVIVINLNPLIKLDGYYFLTETIGIPDLKERSTAFLSGWVQSRVLRLPVDIPPVAKRRVTLFVLYAIASGTYSYLLLFTVIRFTYNIGYNWFAEFAVIPAGALAYAVFRSRLVSLTGVIRRLRERITLSGTRRYGWVVILLLVLFFVPLTRDHENALYLVEPEHSATVYPATPGRVATIFVREGQRVRAGDPLLELDRSLTADAMGSAASEQADAARFQTFDAQVTGRSLGIAAASRDAAARSEDLANEVHGLLTLRAPIDGTVITAEPENLVNQNVREGQPLLSLAGDKETVARIFVPAAALDRVPADSEVALDPPGQFGIVRLQLSRFRLQGVLVSLPPGLASAQDLKGLAPPAFYAVRLPLPRETSGLRFGMSGTARISGARRSIYQHAVAIVLNLVRAHVW